MNNIVLGIETSCDETAAAVVASDRRILSNIVFSQLDEHRPYGGVVPEIAARAHVEALDLLVAQAMDKAGMGFNDLSGVAVTTGPGLIGGVIVGVMTAKAIASVHNLPFLAVNHLEGHALTARLTDNVAFPFLLLLVSGGHSAFLVAEAVGRYHMLGGTLDDAVGESFDKVAKMLGLPYPGGPQVEKLAREGDPSRFALPRPLAKDKEGCNLSFSGLKTAVLRASQTQTMTEQAKADLCAAFQHTVAESLAERTANAIRLFKARHPGGDTLVVAGGVASNQYLRAALTQAAEKAGLCFCSPPPALCTDNAAMIAWAGVERLQAGFSDPLDVEPRARWPLGEAA